MKELPEKLYYKIGEIADAFDVNTSLIRFWEKEFKILNPKKNKQGIRVYTKKDLETFQQIFFLVKEKGFTLDGAKQRLKKPNVESENESSVSQQVVLRLKQIKNELLQIKNALE